MPENSDNNEDDAIIFADDITFVCEGHTIDVAGDNLKNPTSFSHLTSKNQFKAQEQIRPLAIRSRQLMEHIDRFIEHLKSTQVGNKAHEGIYDKPYLERVEKIRNLLETSLRNIKHVIGMLTRRLIQDENGNTPSSIKNMVALEKALSTAEILISAKEEPKALIATAELPLSDPPASIHPPAINQIIPEQMSDMTALSAAEDLKNHLHLSFARTEAGIYVAASSAQVSLRKIREQVEILREAIQELVGIDALVYDLNPDKEEDKEVLDDMEQQYASEEEKKWIKLLGETSLTLEMLVQVLEQLHLKTIKWHAGHITHPMLLNIYRETRAEIERLKGVKETLKKRDSFMGRISTALTTKDELEGIKKEELDNQIMQLRRTLILIQRIDAQAQH